MQHGPTIFCGDPHGQFDQIIEAATRVQARAVVLLGDMEAVQPLELELASILDRTLFIPGNHDSDTDGAWRNLRGAALTDRNLHGRVVKLPDGLRVAGLGGVFRGTVWMPTDPGAPRFQSRALHGKTTPRQDRWEGGPPRKHASTIYPAELNRLADLRADVLVTHEAPGYHPHGFAILDDLARSLGVRVVIHGHHHDALDSSKQWAAQGFQSYGVGLRGVSALWPDGRWEVVTPGEVDGEREMFRRIV